MYHVLHTTDAERNHDICIPGFSSDMIPIAHSQAVAAPATRARSTEKLGERRPCFVRIASRRWPQGGLGNPKNNCGSFLFKSARRGVIRGITEYGRYISIYEVDNLTFETTHRDITSDENKHMNLITKNTPISNLGACMLRKPIPAHAYSAASSVWPVTSWEVGRWETNPTKLLSSHHTVMMPFRLPELARVL